MQYKTIILELVQQRPELHEQLRTSRKLLPTVETWARELKDRHDAWKDQLLQARPESAPQQITSEALEIALHEMENRFSCEPPNDHAPLSLDNAMTFVRNHTSDD